MSLAAASHDLLIPSPPPVMPVEPHDAWTLRPPVMRAFPRLAVAVDEPPVAESCFNEEPERWDGMA